MVDNPAAYLAEERTVLLIARYVRKRRARLRALSLACLLFACGDEATSHRPQGTVRDDPEASDDHNTETSAAPANGSASERDSGAPMAPSGPPFTFQTCPGITEVSLPQESPRCDGDYLCGAEAHCYPISGLAQTASAPDCSVGKCLPDKAFAAQGRIALQRCDGSGGPGVCAPHCFALMREALSFLFPRGEAGCGAEEICAPCFNPLNGSSTGACDDRCGATP